MVLGRPDAGKTTLVAHVASRLAEGGSPVGVVDADLGQSEIGPPTTVGLGRVHGPLGRLRDAEVLALAFVGATSPAGNLLGTLAGVGRMVARGRALGLERVLVDTSGLVTGDLGRALKQAKIDLLGPALVLCLQRAGECEHILRAYDVTRAPAVLRLPALDGPGGRSAEARRQHRRERLQAWLAGARPVTLDLRRVALREPSARLVGMLAGLESAESELLGLGVVQAHDLETATLRVLTPVAPEAVARVTVGRASPED